MIVNPRRRNQVHFPQSRLGTETNSQIDDSNLMGRATNVNAEGEGPKAFQRTKIRKQKKTYTQSHARSSEEQGIKSGRRKLGEGSHKKGEKYRPMCNMMT